MIDNVIGYFPELIGICVFIGIAEILSSVLWWRFYFSFGIPVYKRTIRLKTAEMKLPNADDIEEYAISDNPRHPRILVRQINRNAFGFRETMFFYRLYFPVMHGYIYLNNDNNEIKIRGYSNWYMLAFTCLFLTFTLAGVIATKDFSFLAMAILPLAMIGSGYMTQRKRFDGISEILHKLYG
jgi:hypothetical protein